MKSLSRLVVGLICLVSAAAGQAQNRACSSDKGGGRATLRVVVVLRPRVKIAKNSPEDVRLGASEQTETGFQSELEKAFVDKGYKLWVDPDHILDWEQSSPNEAAFKVLKDHFDSLFPKDFLGSPDSKTLLRTSFKSDLEEMNDSKEFGAFVLARARGYLLTKFDNIINLGALVGGTGRDGDLHMSIAVVGRSSGSVLYYCESTASGAYVLNPERLSKGIHKCLKGFSNGPGLSGQAGGGKPSPTS